MRSHRFQLGAFMALPPVLWVALLLTILSAGNPASGQVEQSNDYVPKADVLLVRKGRVVKPFKAIPNTDSGRGAALLAARNAATNDGDSLVIGPGVFDLGTQVLDLSRSGSGYIHARGVNSDATLISSANTGGGASFSASILHPGSGSRVYDLGVLGNLTNGDYQGIVGGHSDTQSAFTGALFYNCKFTGQSDSFYVNHTSACTAKFYSCEFVSTYDTILLASSSSHVFQFFNCYWNATGPNISASQPGRCRAIRVQSGLCQVFGGEIICAEGGATDNKAVQTISATATIELYGGVRISSTNTGAATPYDLANQGGAIKITPDVIYDSARTTGTITILKTMGVTPSATGLALLSALDASAGRTAIGAGTATSVGLSLPGIFTVTGSPVTTSGTLSATLANQSAAQVFAGPASGSAAAPTFRSLVDTDTPKLFTIGGLRLTGVTFRNAFLGNSASGNNDIYTCPVNKRAVCTRWLVYNGNGSTDSVYPTIKISGTTYRLGSATNVTTGNYSAATNMPSIVLEAGETIGMNHSQTTANTWITVVEFDNTCPLKTVKLLSLSAGDNTLYTASGVSAYLLDTAMNTGGLTAVVNYVNSSGGSRTAYLNFVPSAGSAASTNKASQSISVNDGNRQSFTCPAALGAGDFISINTDAATATQLAWVNVVEF